MSGYLFQPSTNATAIHVKTVLRVTMDSTSTLARAWLGTPATIVKLVGVNLL